MLAQIFLKCLRFTLFSKEKGKRNFLSLWQELGFGLHSTHVIP